MMPAWREARHAGRSARNRALGERTEGGDHESRRINRHECYHCGSQEGLVWQEVAPGLTAMVCRKCRRR